MTDNDDTGEATKLRPTFGRRRGRKLRKGRQQLVDALLPRLRLEPPADGSRLSPEGLFADPMEDLWLEVGFGGGEHLAAQALAHPSIGMIGCEPFVNGVAGLVSRIDEEGIANIRIFDDDARLLFDALPDAGIGKAFVLFSDPWPKKKHWERRFISSATLNLLARLMKDGALLRFASDHMGYVRWVLRHVIAHPDFSWTARGPRDWRQSPADGFETRYEAKAAARGDRCVFLQFERLARH